MLKWKSVNFSFQKWTKFKNEKKLKNFKSAKMAKNANSGYFWPFLEVHFWRFLRWRGSKRAFFGFFGHFSEISFLTIFEKVKSPKNVTLFRNFINFSAFFEKRILILGNLCLAQKTSFFILNCNFLNSKFSVIFIPVYRPL